MTTEPTKDGSIKRFRAGVTVKDVSSSLFFILILPGLVVYLTIFTANNSKLTALESGLLQLLGILASAATSYYAAKKSAEKDVQQRAKLALRRIFTLYTFFPRFIQSVEEHRKFLDDISENDGRLDKNYVNQTLNALNSQVYEQIGAVNDSVDDWKDLVPHPEEILSKYQEDKND